MRLSTGMSMAALAGSAFAAPTQKRAAITDADILNYALTLEHLEDTFYAQGLANYSQADFASHGFDATFYKNLKEVSMDESTHVAFLTAGLKAAGATPVAACTYDFGVSDPTSFIKLASVLEGVGVSAYLGAAADIMSKTYLTDAGSILTVEARHSAYIRAAVGEVPFPSPFDTPLDFDEVYSLASQFIASCPPSNPKLPVKAFPVLAESPSQPMPVKPGDTVTLMSKATTQASHAAWASVTGPVFVPVTYVGGGEYKVQVPAKDIYGQSYVLLTNCDTAVTDDTIISGPAIVEVTGSM